MYSKSVVKEIPVKDICFNKTKMLTMSICDLEGIAKAIKEDDDIESIPVLVRKSNVHTDRDFYIKEPYILVDGFYRLIATKYVLRKSKIKVILVT